MINPSACASVCVCLSVHEHISGTAEPIGTKFCVRIPCGRGSVLLRRRCATLCTSGFMDDVTCGRNGRDAKTERRMLTCAATAMNDVTIPRPSLMPINAFFAIKCRSRRKNEQMQKFLGPIFSWGTTQTVLQHLVSAIYRPTFSKVWLSSVC